MAKAPALKSLLPAHLADQVEAARNLISARHSKATRRAYESDMSDFSQWGATNGLDTLPASVEAVVLYLSSLSEKGLKASSIARKVSAIRFNHTQAGLPSPTDAEPVKAVVAGIRRTKGTAPRQVAPATVDIVERMIQACKDDLRGIRDRALISIGFGAALRRSELSALTLENISITPKGLVLNLPRSKTDPNGKGQHVAVLDGPRIKATHWLQHWLASSGIGEGRVFRLTDRQIANVIKSRAAAAGLDPSKFSGHSLRSGFVTSAAQAGADLFRLMDVTRHRSVETVRGYVRRETLFDGHAGQPFM